MTEIQRRFLELRSHPETVVVNYPGDSISLGPLYSREYASCNGVALLAEEIAGLTHHDSGMESEIYLNEIINRMERQGQFPNSAVVVAGDERHLEKNLRVLEERGIAVANGYSDNWSEVPLLTEGIFKSLRLKMRRSENKSGLKDILVVPETKEVLVYRLNQRDFIRLN